MPAGNQGEWRPSYNPWLIAFAVMLATFMEVMDTSISSVAVPYIAGSVSASNEEAEWVLTVYLIANAVFLPSSTWFAQRFGRKCFLITSILVFTAASFACGIAPSLGFLLLARAVQGAGGGALQPLAQAILVESFPPEKQGLAMGMYAVGVVVAPIVGPAVGGYLTDAISWRWAYYINIPIGLLAVLMQKRVLEDPPYIRNANPGPLDRYGLAFLGMWSACMEFIADKGQENDWFGSASIRWAAVFLVVGLAAFILRELTHDKPLVNLRSLKDRNLALGSFLIFLLGAGVYAVTAVWPLFFQTLMGYDATTAGLAVTPRGLGSVITAVTVGAISAKVDARRLVALGFAIFAGASFWITNLTLNVAEWSMFWPILVSGAGITMTFVPLASISLGTLPKDQVGNASGIFNLARNVGGSLGISTFNTVAQRHLQSHRDQLAHQITAANPALRQTFAHLNRIMAQHAGPRKAMLRSMHLIQTGLDRQSQLYAYVDDFLYLAIACACCVPLAFLLKRVKKGAAGPA